MKDDGIGQRVYRYSIVTRIPLLFGIAVSVSCWLLPLGRDEESVMLALCFSLLSVPLFIYLVQTFDRIELTESGITQHRLMGVDRYLSWDEMADLRSSFFNRRLTVYDQDGRTRIPLDWELVGFVELVEVLQEKRPDLWLTPSDQVFHRHPLILVVPLGGGLLMWLGGLLGLLGLLQGRRIWDWVVLGMGCMSLFYCAYDVRRVVLGKDLELVSWLRVHKFAKEEVKGVIYRITEVLVNLSSGKTLRLAGFKEGNELLYHSLKLWLEGDGEE